VRIVEELMEIWPNEVCDIYHALLLALCLVSIVGAFTTCSGVYRYLVLLPCYKLLTKKNNLDLLLIQVDKENLMEFSLD